ncbi:hypothetical protein [Pseudomonas sp. UMAB-40]|jgi:hypothetical protein|nr:hypothetical protein [Pseudomonas sp. UMAB-40]
MLLTLVIVLLGLWRFDITADSVVQDGRQVIDGRQYIERSRFVFN